MTIKIYSIVSIKKIVLDQVIANHVKTLAIKLKKVSSIPGFTWWKTSMDSSCKVFSGLHIEAILCAYTHMYTNTYEHIACSFVVGGCGVKGPSLCVFLFLVNE